MNIIPNPHRVIGINLVVGSNPSAATFFFLLSIFAILNIDRMYERRYLVPYSVNNKLVNKNG